MHGWRANCIFKPNMSKWSLFTRFLLIPRVILSIYILLAFATAIQAYLLGSFEFKMPDKAPPGHDIVNNLETMKQYIGCRITNYNNYIIFKQSWFHLISGKNLYVIYPHEYWDLYKYSPSFAFLMAPFAYLPDLLSLFLWSLLNAGILYLAVQKLPFSERKKSIFLLFLIPELMTSIQNLQTNALLAGLILLAHHCLQNRKSQWATLWLVLATVIKVYGAVGFCLFLFYPDKIKFILWAAFWTLLLVLMPLLVSPVQTLIWQYHNWGMMLTADQSSSYGLSVMGWLHSWFGLDSGKNYVILVGLLLFFVPLLRIKLYKDDRYRILMLAYMLVWVIIFNHKAESPTFVIAVCGIFIWYFSGPRQYFDKMVFALVFVFTSLSVTDIFPPYVKDHFFIPYCIKVVPCIIGYFVILSQLVKLKELPGETTI